MPKCLNVVASGVQTLIDDEKEKGGNLSKSIANEQYIVEDWIIGFSFVTC